MRYADYFHFLESPKPLNFLCPYCGSFIYLENTDEGICPFCEAYLSSQSQTTQVSQGGKLADVQKLIDSGKMDDAWTALNAATAQNMNPSILYGAANIYGVISDYKYHDLDYNRKGFMEENSKNVYASLDATAKSKELFYKAITLFGNQNENINASVYLTFISYIKLKRYVDAGRVLSLMGSNLPQLSKEYASMVYNSESKKASPYKQIIALIGKGNINSIYYLAKYYAHNKKLEESKQILEILTKKVRMPMASFLLYKVDKLLEETEL